MKKVVIIGAGPAGITAGYELVKKSKDYDVTIMEATGVIGGIARTVNHNGNLMDLGGHRFFTNSEEVKNWWEEILSKQGQPAKDDRILKRSIPTAPGGPDPEFEDDVMLVRKRVSSIHYNDSFIEYPVRFNSNTVKSLGFGQAAKAGFSYLESSVFKKKEDNLENYLLNHFGKQLYQSFFEKYTEKLWGRHPSQISAEWGAQRLKGLSVSSILKDKSSKRKNPNAQEDAEFGEEFLYPKFGPGQLWDLAARKFTDNGGRIRFRCKVTGIETENNVIKGVRCEFDGQEFFEPADIIISSMPIKELILSMKGVPFSVEDVAKGLPYRDLVVLGILVPSLKIKNTSKIKTLNDIIPECWIYVQDSSVKVGRIQIYNNWSPYLLQKPEENVWIGLEYCCSEGDYYWNQSDIQWQKLAVEELAKLGIIESNVSVLDFNKVMVPKAYPAYFDSYNRFDEIKNYLDNFPNLYCVGRNGQHRYNNMDHCMMTSFETVKTILAGKTDKTKVWAVNRSAVSYHDSTSLGVTPPAEQRNRTQAANVANGATMAPNADLAAASAMAKENAKYGPMMSIRDRLSLRSMRKPKTNTVNYALLDESSDSNERNSYRNANVPIRSNYQAPAAEDISEPKQQFRRKPSGVHSDKTMPENTYVVNSAPVKKETVFSTASTFAEPVVPAAPAAPVAEEPVVAAVPVMEEPVAAAPVIEEPVAAAPVIEEPAPVVEPVSWLGMGDVTRGPAEEPVAEEAIIAEPVIEEAPVEEAVIEEAPTEEPVAEETYAEPVVEETYAEPVAEEAVVEEAAIEEAVIEEAPAEEPVAEEAYAEPVAEEAVIHESVIEETPVEEPVAEETYAEPVVEEVPAEEPVAEEAYAEPVAEEPVSAVYPEPSYDENGTPFYYDENGTPYYLDENGNAIYYDENGNQIFYDENGSPYFYDENGTPVYYDENGNPIYYDENGNQIFYDEAGIPFYYDENGTPLYYENTTEAATATAADEPTVFTPRYFHEEPVYDEATGTFISADEYAAYSSRNEEYDSFGGGNYADGYETYEQSADDEGVYNVDEVNGKEEAPKVIQDGAVLKTNDFGNLFAMPTEEETKRKHSNVDMPFIPVAPTITIGGKKEEKKEFLNQTGAAATMERIEKVMKTEINIRPKKEEEPVETVPVVSVPKPTYKKATGVFTPKPMTEEEKKKIEEEEKAKRPIAPSMEFKPKPEEPKVEEKKSIKKPRRKNFVKPDAPLYSDWDALNAKTLREIPEMEEKKEETPVIRVEKSDLPTYDIYASMSYDGRKDQYEEPEVSAEDTIAASVQAAVEKEARAKEIAEERLARATQAAIEAAKEEQVAESAAVENSVIESTNAAEEVNAAAETKTAEETKTTENASEERKSTAPNINNVESIEPVSVEIKQPETKAPVKHVNLTDIEVPKDLFANAKVIAVIKNGVKTNTADGKQAEEQQPVKKSIQKYTSDFETTTVKSIRKLRAMRQEKAIQDITRMLEGTDERRVVQPRPKAAAPAEPVETAPVIETTPVVEKPVMSAPAVETPVADIPAAEVPAAQTPAAKAPVAETFTEPVPAYEAPAVEPAPVQEEESSFIHLDLRLKDGSHRVVEEMLPKMEELKGEASAVEETPAAEEIPVVEETPIVEEIPAVEEIPVVEETPAAEAAAETPATGDAPAVPAEEAPKPKRTYRKRTPKAESTEGATDTAASAEGTTAEEAPKPKRTYKKRTPKAESTEGATDTAVSAEGAAEEAPKPKRTYRKRTPKADLETSTDSKAESVSTEGATGVQMSLTDENGITVAAEPVKKPRKPRAKKTAVTETETSTTEAGNTESES